MNNVHPVIILSLRYSTGSAGFTGMEIYRDEKKPWITVVGRKG